MKTVALFLVLVALLLTPQTPGDDAAEARVLTGEYSWGSNTGALEVVFTRTGAGEWNVAFHFSYRGPKVYSGTAVGSLVEGPLEGTVHDEERTRTFNFRGTFEKGSFRGTHYEVKDGREHRRGTLSLG